MGMIASGRRERITILKLVKTKSASGAVSESYVFFKNLSAEISYKTSTEKEINNQTTPLNVIKIKLRWRRDLDETMIVELFNQKYDIRYIEHNKRIETFITAERGKL